MEKINESIVGGGEEEGMSSLSLKWSDRRWSSGSLNKVCQLRTISFQYKEGATTR